MTAPAPVSIAERMKLAETIKPAAPLKISATSYRWCDPATIPQRPWVYGRQFLRGTVSVVIAPGATGKTALLIGTAMALATGRALLGKDVWDRPQRVWLWNLEDSGEELSRLIQACALHWRIKEADVADRLLVDSGLDGAELKIAIEDRDGFKIAVPVADALVEELTARAIDVLIVDPFVSSHGANENDNGAIDAIAKLWARIAVQANCAIVLAHHVSKAGAGEVTALSARGAVALVNAARSALTLNRMSEEEAERYGIDGDERRRFFRAYDDKNNRAPPADVSDWYRLASVSLGNGRDGGDGDSLQVVVPWEPPQAFDGVSVDHLRRVQAKVAAGEWRKSDQTAEWVGHAIADVLDLDLDKPTNKKRVKALLKEWIASGALVEENRRDRNRDMRPFIVVGRHVDDAAVPPESVVRQGAAVRHCSTAAPPRPPLGGSGGAAAAEGGFRGAAKSEPILAPGEGEDDPVPGWEN